MNKIIVTKLPTPHGQIKGCWYNGYPIHQGHTEDSLNYATLHANENNLLPDQQRIERESEHFHQVLKNIGFEVIELPFPEELNQPNCLHHDAVFVRDAGLMFEDKWIKARFSATSRQIEAEVYADLIANQFNKEIINLPEGAYLEFGEIYYLKTKKGSFYFGGLSRSNKQGHDFVQSIVQADHYYLISSEGYHLDTVFSPVLNKQNELVALILTEGMIHEASLNELKTLNLEIIYVDDMDASGHDDILGNYAVNCLVAPGILVNAAKFETPGVEKKLRELEVKCYHAPLTDFRFAGGSVHCLTNEIYDI